MESTSPSKEEVFVGFDTSNYTTSVAVCNRAGEVIANLKSPLPVGKNACGLRQSDAVFAHIKNLPGLTEQLREILRGRAALAVGVSTRPRDAADSYMPCFLTGWAAACAFSSADDLPLYTFSHQNGHIMAAMASSGAEEKLRRGQFLAFHVSGGTTEVLLVTPAPCGFSVSLLGETADINAGQAIDRTGVTMGLSFPCGKQMEELANAYTGKIPKPRVCVEGTVCHLSGLQNLAAKCYAETADRGLVSAYVFRFITETLAEMTKGALKLHPGLPVLYAGGVMSNRRIATELSNRFDAAFAQPAYSADNAAGIALLCRRKYLFDAGIISNGDETLP